MSKWLADLDAELTYYARIISGGGVIKVAVDGGKKNLDRNQDGVRRFLEQIGFGVVEPYAIRMAAILAEVMMNADWPAELADVRADLVKFLNRKVREELVHERQWWRMARAWGVQKPGVCPELDPDVLALGDHLAEVVRNGTILQSFFVICFVMDTLSVSLGATVAGELLPSLAADQRDWLKSRSNTESNREHAEQVRRFIEQLAGPDPSLSELMQLLRITSELFSRAVLSAYNRTDEDQFDADQAVA